MSKNKGDVNYEKHIALVTEVEGWTVTRRLTSSDIGLCRTCDEVFLKVRNDQKYCNPLCRHKAYRDRKGAS